MYDPRCTPLDYAKLYNQTDCIDLLVAAGATTRADIMVLAATMIQAGYRGYKSVTTCSERTIIMLFSLGLGN